MKKTVYGLKRVKELSTHGKKKQNKIWSWNFKFCGRCLFIARDATGNAVTYIVGYVDDLIVADRSDQNHVSKQIMECIIESEILESEHWRNFNTLPWRTLDQRC
jgi:hypothetical protein